MVTAIFEHEKLQRCRNLERQKQERTYEENKPNSNRDIDRTVFCRLSPRCR